MGWEYHNRQRGKHGRWAETGHTVQLHIWVPPRMLELIRGRAYARHLSISEYITDLVQRDLMPCNTAED